MEEIIKILMERDNISRDEAIELIDKTINMLSESIVENDIFEACEIFYEQLKLDLMDCIEILGLDPEFIDKLLDF